MPTAKGPHPAVILISRSGAQDRDGSVAGHRPFLVLADHLTRNGIAVLRVDHRGVGGSDLGSPAATSENFAGDVLAGIQSLESRKDIKGKRIGLIGHAERVVTLALGIGANTAIFSVVNAFLLQTCFQLFRWRRCWDMVQPRRHRTQSS